ncbi:MAG: histidine kinase [Bacteroidales bacterium]
MTQRRHHTPTRNSRMTHTLAGCSLVCLLLGTLTSPTPARAGIPIDKGYSAEYADEMNTRLQEALRNNDTTSLALGLMDLGFYYALQGNHKQALEYYEDAGGYFDQLNDQHGFILARISMAQQLAKLEELRKALKLYEESANLAEDLPDSSLMARGYLGTAEVLSLMGKDDRALPLFTKSRDLARSQHLKDVLVAALNGLSAIENKHGDYLSSMVHYKESKAITDSITTTEPLHREGAVLMPNPPADQSRLFLLEKEYQAQKYKMARHQLITFGLAGALGILLIAGALLYFTIRMRNRRNTARLTLQNLRQQMNPHFLFNVMNSVYLHLLEDKREESIDYLSRLNKLIRKTLENSREDMVSLAEEIELLQLYLELEQKRLRNISWEIRVDPGLHPEELQVPSMLIQPYVENSVIHGISNMEGEGRVKVLFRMNGGTVHCEIADNGIGRKKAGGLNRGTNHRSLGTGITAARLELLNSYYRKPVKVIYSEIRGEEDMPGGTRVLLDIPYEETTKHEHLNS